MAKSKNNFYVVWTGKVPGVYNRWDKCEEQIKGVEGARFKGFETLDEANKAFEGNPWSYMGKNAGAAKKPNATNASVGKPIAESWSVDAACSGNPGRMEYKGVHTTTKELLFHLGPFEQANNNVGEFLALVHALSLQKKMGISLPIYSDSVTAMAWVRNKKTRSELKRSVKNTKVFELFDKAEAWIQNNSWTSRVIKWETEFWGEIPADFGRK